MALMDYVKLYREKGKEAWGKLNTRQKWIFSGVGVGILVAFIAVIASFGSGGGGRVAIEISGRATPEAALQKLAEFGVAEAKLDNGAITVPKEAEKRATMILLTANYLPDSGKAYEFLFKSDFTTTQHRLSEQQRVTLEQLLGATISNMEGVQDARVTLTAAANPWHYVADQASLLAKASVWVTLKGQDRLQGYQVISISNLVGNSLATLKPDNVTISDQYGRPYSPSSDWRELVTAMEKQAAEERRIVQQAELVMASFRGRGAATVDVRKLNKVSESTEFNDGDEGKVTYEESRDFKKTGTVKRGTAGGDGGEIGRAASADPGRATTAEDHEESEGVRKVEYNKKQVTEIENGLYLTREGITVTYDETHRGVVEQRGEEFKSAIRNSTGVPIEKISLLAVPMPPMQGGAGGLPGWASGLLTPQNIFNGVLLVLAVGAFVTLMVMLRKSAPKPLTMVDEEIVEEKPEAMPEVPRLPPVSQLEGNLVREKVVELVKKNPAAAANLIKRWMILGK